MPGERQCLVDFQKVQHNIREECERTNGRYIQSFYKTECEAENSRLVFAATDEPFCIGSSCSANEATTLVRNAVEDSVYARLATGGYYNCTITYLRVVEFDSIFKQNAINPISNPGDNNDPTNQPTVKRTETPTSSPFDSPTTAPQIPPSPAPKTSGSHKPPSSTISLLCIIAGVLLSWLVF